MGPLDSLNHLLNFLAPAFWMALFMAMLGPLVLRGPRGPRSTKGPSMAMKRAIQNAGAKKFRRWLRLSSGPMCAIDPDQGIPTLGAAEKVTIL